MFCIILLSNVCSKVGVYLEEFMCNVSKEIIEDIRKSKEIKLVCKIDNNIMELEIDNELKYMILGRLVGKLNN